MQFWPAWRYRWYWALASLWQRRYSARSLSDSATACPKFLLGFRAILGSMAACVSDSWPPCGSAGTTHAGPSTARPRAAAPIFRV